MNSCYLHCARSIHINTDRKQLKQVLHLRFSFEPRFSEVDKSQPRTQGICSWGAKYPGMAWSRDPRILRKMAYCLLGSGE